MMKWLQAHRGWTSLLLLAVAVALSWCIVSVVRGHSAIAPLPPAPANRIEQPRAQYKEQMRQSSNWPGSDKRKFLQVDYSDGRAVVVDYRQDGSIERVRELFPLGTAQNPPSTERRLKGDFVYAANGQTVVQSSVYRDTHTLESAGRSIGPQIFEQWFFDTDGQTPLAMRIWNNNQLIADQRYEKGALSFDGRVKNGALEYTRYRANLTRLFVLNGSAGNYDLDIFDSAGTSRTMHATIGSTTEVQAFTADGHPDQTRTYTSDTMTVVVYHAVTPKAPPAGLSKTAASPAAAVYLPAYKQEWHVVVVSTGATVGGAAAPLQYTLAAVEEMNDKGTVSRRIEFDAKANVQKATEYAATGTISRVRSFTDGVLDSTSLMDSNGTLVRTVKANAKTAGKESIDPQLLLQLPFNDPRPLVSDVNLSPANSKPQAGPLSVDVSSLANK